MSDVWVNNKHPNCIDCQHCKGNERITDYAEHCEVNKKEIYNSATGIVDDDICENFKK